MISIKERWYLESMANKYGWWFEKSVYMIVDMFRRRVPGYECRDWFIEAHGGLIYMFMRRDLSPERFTALFFMHPVLKNVMKPRKDAVEFFREFLTEPG
jgi:hypothetical protein